MRRIQYKTPGHFICAEFCRFFKHTHVGKYCISTVGEYFPKDEDKKPHPVGAGPHCYETLVFNHKRKNHRWSEIDGLRWMTRKEAIRGHERYCRKYKSGVEPSKEETT